MVTARKRDKTRPEYPNKNPAPFNIGTRFEEVQTEVKVRTQKCPVCGVAPQQTCLDTLRLSTWPDARWEISHYGRYKAWLEAQVHESVMAWVPTVLGPNEVAGKRVLEVGSYNVNGSVRDYVMSLGPKEYLGVDAQEGPGVDWVANAEHLMDTVPGSFDVVISTEMLEHVDRWAVCIAEMTEMVTGGGLLVLTTRSPGFPYHPYPVDRWRFTVDGMGQTLRAMDLRDVNVVPDPQVPGIFVTARRPPSFEPWRPPWTREGGTGVAEQVFQGDWGVSPAPAA